MISVAAIVAVAARSAPLVGEVRAAIWSDIELNVTIRDYNELVSWDWYYGVDRNHSPTLTIGGPLLVLDDRFVVISASASFCSVFGSVAELRSGSAETPGVELASKGESKTRRGHYTLLFLEPCINSAD